jgi:large subunit ribosomal protein L1
MVAKEDFVNALKQLKETSPKRKFAQSVDLILNLKELDLKKPEEQLDVWVPLAHVKGKPKRIAALVGPELAEQAKGACDMVITHDQFKAYEGKKKDIRTLAKKNDLFIAQVNIMPDVARYFGRVLGPRGKMPNPKGGCVVPANANLKVVTEKLRRTLHVVAKTQMSAKCSVGKEDMTDDQLIENIMAVFDTVIRALPQGQNNIKNILLKHSMGPPLKVGATAAEKAAGKKKAAIKGNTPTAAPAEAKPAVAEVPAKKAAPKKAAKPKKEAPAKAGEAQ